MELETFKRAAGISSPLAARWHRHVVAAMREFGIDTPTRQAAFIAQIGHESAGFSRIQESFNYTPEALRATFGKRMPYSQASRLGRQPTERTVPMARQMEIANIVYGGRYGNGPTEGWKYAGKGLKQITFKDNYAACGKALGVDLVGDPYMLLTDELAARSAGWFWSANELSKLADAGDFVGLTKAINGGLNGIDDRKSRWAAAKLILRA